jgi:hypothetical protein
MTLKGALVSFTPTFLVPVPSVTVFQFNPETITHSWRQPLREVLDAPNARPGTETTNPQAVSGMPGEDFSLTIMLDANEDIADAQPASAQLALVSGVYSRLSALEMMLYPSERPQSAIGALLGQVSAAAPAAAASSIVGPAAGSQAQVQRSVPDSTVPIVLFVWGPYRIVPVRVTGLTITERLYDGLLNPTHAEVQLGMTVLTPTELKAAKASSKVMSALGAAAYDYTLGVRQAAAVADAANKAPAIIGMLP